MFWFIVFVNIDFQQLHIAWVEILANSKLHCCLEWAESRSGGERPGMPALAE